MSCVSSVSYCIVTVLYIILARPHWKILFIINLITSRWLSRKCAKSKKKGNDLIKTRMKTTKCECRAKKRTNYQTRKRSINERISRGRWGYGGCVRIRGYNRHRELCLLFMAWTLMLSIIYIHREKIVCLFII